VAALLGDRTARQAGRLTLNPLRHLDPFGTLLPLLAAFYGAPGFGWGRPVPIDPRQLRGGRLGLAAVSAAGPLSNVVLAILGAFVLRLGAEGAIELPQLGAEFLLGLIRLNVALAVFNILPVAPLDGFGVAVSFLPRPVAAFLARYGPLVLLLLVGAPFIIGINLLGVVLLPLQRALLIFISRVVGA
jgi:Zn-dependent protease